MANFTKAYNIAFESDTHVTNAEIIPFFKDIEALMQTKRECIVRRINGKLMRVHAYEWSDMNEDYLVIPFGKLKESNKPYGIDNTTQKLVDLPEDMFDVNSLAYHARYRIALITTNILGPSEEDIERYLNSFLPKNAEYRIKISPIKKNTGIDKVRNAIQARSVSFVLDLGRPLDDFFKEQVHEEKRVGDYLKGLMEYSKEDLDSKTFMVTLGLGKIKKATLDIAALLELLETINLDSSSVKEIYVNYKDNTSTKVETAKLKETNIILKIYFDIKSTRLGSEFIKANLEEKLLAERPKYYKQVEEHYGAAIPLEGGYEIVEEWDEGPAT